MSSGQIASVGKGFQLGDGTALDVLFTSQVAPATATTSATLTVDQLATGIVIGDQGSSADASYTLPTATLMDAAFSNMRINTAFDFAVINIGNDSSEDITLVAGTGWTLVGDVVIKDAVSAGDSSAIFRARKTADLAWTLYRLT